MTIPQEVSGLLYSQIGYDLGCPMRAVVRGATADHLATDARWALRQAGTNEAVLEGSVVYWGELWGSHWWVADFSALNDWREVNSGATPSKYPLNRRDGSWYDEHMSHERRLCQ